MCANIYECLRFKCWQRQERQEIISIVEGQVAMPDYLQSTLYMSNCLKTVCHALPQLTICSRMQNFCLGVTSGPPTIISVLDNLTQGPTYWSGPNFLWLWKARGFFALAQHTGASSLCLRQDDKAVGRADKGAWPFFLIIGCALGGRSQKPA